MKLLKKRFILLMCLVWSLLLFTIAPSAESDTFKDSPEASVSLINNLDSIKSGTDLIIGVRFILPEGWDTFWRTPGDVGYGLNFIWDNSKNLESAVVLWPYPTRSKIYDFITNVYEHEVIFPVKVAPKNYIQPLDIQLNIDYLLCRLGECVPHKKLLKLLLPVGSANITKDSPLICQALDKIPKLTNTSNIFLHELSITQISDIKATLNVKADTSESLANSVLFIEGPKELKFGLPTLTLINDKQGSISFSVEKNDSVNTNKKLRALLNSPLLLTFVNHNHAITVSKTAQVRPTGGLKTDPKNMAEAIIDKENTVPHVIPNPEEHMFIGTMLLFAFLGGLILNLMPCVFPILSLKVLTLKSSKNKKMQGIFYTLGVLSSFLVIAIIIIISQSIGKSIGWGFQMQSPLFLIGLIFLFTLVALNLFGFYEVPFSINASSKWQKHHQLLNSFVTGILACIVTTPCSAPFMATAIGVAINRGPWSAVFIFLTLGLGFAMPYLLFCIIPRSKSILPKPGLWMEKVKQFLGFPILLTIIWLLWVAGYQMDHDSVMMLLVSLCFLLLTLWVWKSIRGNTARHIATLLSVALMIYPLYWINQEMKQQVTLDIEVYQFSPEKLESLLNQHRKVFVYATAAWCITCKMNEKIAIETNEVQSFFKKENIAVMKADWTNKNNTIMLYLKSFNRAGIPLYAYYSGSKNVVTLPQLLTPSVIINNLK